MSFFLGDLNSPSLPFSELPRLKYYFIIAIWVHYFLEVVINTHQSYLFVKQQSPTLTDSKEERPHANGRPSAVYRSWMACYWTNIINITLQYDLVPKLWTAAGRAIYYFGTPQTGELADILRTIWFLLFCYGIYAVLNVPELLIRVLYFKEDVLRVWRAKRKSHQIFHDAAQGRPMHLVILVVVESVIMLQGYGRRIDNQYLIITGLLQLVFALLYPILSQPRMKELTLMEDGKSKSALEELASNAGFPLKNLYTIEGHAMTPMIQTTGWPRKANIVINSSLLEECTTENLVALTVQKLGWWSNSSELRQLMISQVCTSCRLHSQKSCLHASSLPSTDNGPSSSSSSNNGKTTSPSDLATTTRLSPW